MNIIIIDKLSKVAESHRNSVILWFAYYFFSITLCIVNIIFFIYNWQDWTISLENETNILLTIIGFLFAFAGINIYSIFNTKIEAEKERLVEMRGKYEKAIDDSIKNISFISDISKLQLYSQMTYSLRTNNSQLLEWLGQITETAIRIKSTLDRFKDYETYSSYCTKSSDVTALARSIGYMSDNFLQFIDTHEREFFGSLDKENIEFVKCRIRSVQLDLAAMSPDLLEEDEKKHEKCRITDKLKKSTIIIDCLMRPINLLKKRLHW